MSSYNASQLLASMPVQGSLYNTFTTAKSILTSTASEASSGLAVLPGGFFQRGGYLDIEFSAGLSNLVTTPGTLTLQVMLGAVIAFSSGAIQLSSTANVLAPIQGRIILTPQTLGAGTSCQLRGMGSLMGTPIAGSGTGANFAAGNGFAMLPQAAPALGTGFDQTLPQTLDLFAGFSVSNAANGIQLWHYRAISVGNSAV